MHTHTFDRVTLERFLFCTWAAAKNKIVKKRNVLEMYYRHEKRDVQIRKEKCVWDKKYGYGKRDVYVYGKRDMYMGRGTYISVKRSVFEKRETCKKRET